jgi:hypothetical protein
MKSLYHIEYGTNNLTMQHTSKTDLPIDISRIIPPYEAWSILKPEVTHFRIFDSHAWARIPSEKKKTLDPQSIECIFLGYPDGVKGYHLTDLSLDRIIIE